MNHRFSNEEAEDRPRRHRSSANGSMGRPDPASSAESSSRCEGSGTHTVRRLYVAEGRKRTRPAYSGFQRHGTKSGFTGSATRLVTAGCLTPVVPTSSPPSKILSRKFDGPTLVSRLFSALRTARGVARPARADDGGSRARSATVAGEFGWRCTTDAEASRNSREQPAASLAQLGRTMGGVVRDPRQPRVNSVGAVRPTRRRSATAASESSPSVGRKRRTALTARLST